MTQAERIKNFVDKTRMLGAGDFTVDMNESMLVRCKPGEYGRLELPPVETISRFALEGIKAKEIIIPETVISIDSYTFYKCKADILTILGNIKELTNNKNLINIKIKTINIGKSVKSRAIFGVISDIEELEAINVSEDNSWYASNNGILYNKDFTELIAYPRNHPQQVYIIPDTVKGIIKGKTFYDIAHLKKLKLSDNIAGLEPEAIWCCDRLKEIEIGRGIEALDRCALINLKSLKILKINRPIEIINI